MRSFPKQNLYEIHGWKPHRTKRQTVGRTVKPMTEPRDKLFPGCWAYSWCCSLPTRLPDPLLSLHLSWFLTCLSAWISGFNPLNAHTIPMLCPFLLLGTGQSASLPHHPTAVHVCCCFTHVWLFVWTVAHQAFLSMGLSKEEYWSGLPCFPPGDLPDPGFEPMSLMSPALAGRLFITSTTWETPPNS